MNTNQVNTYYYVVNLFERGEFCADVRTSKDETVYEIDSQTAQELIDDGFIKHVFDLKGLKAHLSSMGFIGKEDKLELIA